MMGSETKIAALRKELHEEGITSVDLSHVRMPIGLKIGNKTAAEIAISIAGEITSVVNL